MTTSVICLHQNQMNESNRKAFKLGWSIKECILLAFAMRISAKLLGILQINFLISFPTLPAISFIKEKKSLHRVNCR